VAGRARRWLLGHTTDHRCQAKLPDERLVFRALEQEGALNRYRSARIFEVGHKHGQDSLLLAPLNPLRASCSSNSQRSALLEKVNVPSRHVTFAHVDSVAWPCRRRLARCCAVVTDQTGRHRPKSCSVPKIS
jgi:hypothetical protein